MKSLTVGKKLFASFGALAVLLAVIGVVTITGFRSVKARFDQAAKIDVQKLQLSSRFAAATWSMRSDYRGMMLYNWSRQPDKLEWAAKGFAKGIQDANTALDQLAPLVATEKEKALVKEGKDSVAKYQAAYGEVNRLLGAGKMDEGTEYSAKNGVPYGIKASEVAPKLDEIIRGQFENSRKEVESLEATARWLAISVLAIGFVVGAGIFVIVRQVNGNLRSVTAELAQGSGQIANAAAQVSSSSQALAQGASEQAASLEETSSSTEEIGSMTRKNADNSNNSAQLMGEMAGSIEEGNRKLENLVSSMKAINDSSEKISKIIKTIDEIAFQTNILALNAAVEAARAGEAGMGFAVVADEVRNLARRCADAARDTTALIEDSVAKSNEGSRRLDEVAGALGTITSGADQVKVLVDEVSVGSQEQARGLEQIAKAISQMEQVTQKTAASAEESAAAGQELSAQSESLNGLVKRLGDMVGSDRS